jgi:hypothetical protein
MTIQITPNTKKFPSGGGGLSLLKRIFEEEC